MQWLQRESRYAPFYLVALRAFGLCLGLSFVSFLKEAGALTMLAVLLYSVWCYLRPSSVTNASGYKGYFSARYLQGILPGLIATSILQLAYFISGADLFPFSISLVLFTANLFLYVVISFTGVGIGEIILWSSGDKKRKLSRQNEQVKASLSSQFDERLKQLTVIVLLFYVQMHVILPVTSTVYASEQLSADEFIETYDPENKYEVSTETVDIDVSRKMPVDEVVLLEEGSVGSPVVEMSAKERFIQEETKKMDAANRKKIAELTQKKLSLENLESLLQKESITFSEFVTLSIEGVKNGSISVHQVMTYIEVKLTRAGLDSEVRGALRDYLFSFANPIAFARLLQVVNKKTDGGLVHGTQEFLKRAGEKLGEGATWVKENPKEAAIGAVLVVGIIVLTAVCPPAGAVAALVLTGVGVGVTGITLYDAYQKDGVEGVRREVISDETVSMWKSGDYTGAIGRGSVEAGVFVILNLPSVGATQIGKIGQIKNAITGLTKARVSISVAIEGGELSVQSGKILRGVFKGVSGDDAVMRYTTVLLADPKSSFNVLLNKQSAGVGGTKNAEKAVIAVAKENLIVNLKEGYTKLPVEFKAWLKDIKRTNASYGIKADTSRFAEYRVQHIVEGNINGMEEATGFHFEGEGVAGRIDLDTIAPHPEALKGNLAYKGVYSAKVEVWGFEKVGNSGKSTFFPKQWSGEDVINAINEAYESKKYSGKSNIFVGTTKEGMEVLMRIDKNGKILTAHPN